MTDFMRRLLPSAFALLCALFAATGAAAAPQDGARVGIAAVVNEDIITFSDIEERLKLYLLGAPGNPPPHIRQQMVEQVFSRLVNERLQMQEADNLGIAVEPSELEHAFGTIAGQNNVSAEEFRARLKAAGVSPATLEDQIRAELAWAQVVRRKLRPQVNISEGEIDTELSRLQRGSGNKEYRVAEIFLSFDGKATEKAALEKAQDLAAEIRKGRQFSLVARQHSEAPGAATGGDLGWIEQGVLDPRLEQALESLRPGQLSDPVRTDTGFHLLFLRDVRQKGLMPPAPPSPAAPQEQAQAAENRPSLVTTEAAPGVPPTPPVERLLLKRIVFPVAPGEADIITQTKLSRAESLRRDVTSCAGMDTAMQNFNTEGTGNMDVKIGELPAAMRDTLAGLPEGTLSPPVREQDSISLLMVCGRENGQEPLPVIEKEEGEAGEAAETAAAGPAPAAAAPAPSPSEQQRENIANRLGMQRLDQMAERYLRDLRATAYIDKRF